MYTAIVLHRKQSKYSFRISELNIEWEMSKNRRAVILEEKSNMFTWNLRRPEWDFFTQIPSLHEAFYDKLPSNPL